MQHHRIVALPVAAVLLAQPAGERAPAGPETDHAAAHAVQLQQNRAAAPVRAHGDMLRAVRQETARFNSTTQAIRAGYAGDDHCVAHPQLGAMGHHWVNMPLIDPVFDPMQPEVLVYAPGPGGNLRLVGVEYIVIALPGQAVDGPARPSFDGHPFDIGGVGPLMEAGVPHWSLHAWAHADNPAGRACAVQSGRFLLLTRHRPAGVRQRQRRTAAVRPAPDRDRLTSTASHSTFAQAGHGIRDSSQDWR